MDAVPTGIDPHAVEAYLASLPGVQAVHFRRCWCRLVADRAIHVIEDAPERWSIIEAEVRHYLMPRFPYAIYYRALSDHLRILAFKHHSRHPDYWRYRLSD